MSEETLNCIICGEDLVPYKRFGPPHADSSAGPICWDHIKDMQEAENECS